MIGGIISTLLHELGHCVFYWIQGIPAAMSPTKELPLKDITATQHAIGCAGETFANKLVTSQETKWSIENAYLAYLHGAKLIGE
jgi:hypothetical protein